MLENAILLVGLKQMTIHVLNIYLFEYLLIIILR